VLARRNVLEKDTSSCFLRRKKGNSGYRQGREKHQIQAPARPDDRQSRNLVLYQRNDRSYVQEASIISLFSRIKKEEALLHNLYLFLFVLNELLPRDSAKTPYIPCS
jgi:hypothetical protein